MLILVIMFSILGYADRVAPESRHSEAVSASHLSEIMLMTEIDMPRIKHTLKSLQKKKYGRLGVLNVFNSPVKAGYPVRRVLCICDCGNKTEPLLGNVLNGTSQSCGCLHIEQKVTHGYSFKKNRHPLYEIWIDMKKRCYNKKEPSYKNYGGRGISVCNEWKDNAKIFIEWCLKNGWEKELQIDRENNDGNYSPDNVRFVTRSTNLRNSRTTKLNIEAVKVIRFLRKKRVPAKKLMDIYNVSASTIQFIQDNRTWRDVII